MNFEQPPLSSYQTGPEEVERAEAMLTSEQKRVSYERAYQIESEQTQRLALEAFQDVLLNNPERILDMLHSDRISPYDLTMIADKVRTPDGKVYLTISRYAYDRDSNDGSLRMWTSEPEVRNGHPNRSANTIATSVADMRLIHTALERLGERMNLQEVRDISDASATIVLESTLYVFESAEQEEVPEQE